MKRGLVILSIIIVLTPFILASDISVWQGQYYTGTTFNTGTYEFNFSVYDELTGGNLCYTNTSSLTTGNFGEWKTEQIGVNAACNNISKDYYLNVNVDGIDQGSRKRVVIWNFLRKDVNEITSGRIQTGTQIIAPIIQANSQIVAPIVNATEIIANTRVIAPVINATQIIATNLTTTTGFFSFLGSLVNRITKLWIVDIDATGNINTEENVTAAHFFGDGSQLTGLSDSGISWAQAINGTLALNFSLSNYYPLSNPYGYINTTINNSYYLATNPFGFYNSTTLPSTNALTPAYLSTNLNATNAGYTTVFNTTLTPNKINIIQVYLAQSSSTAGVAIQNRVITDQLSLVGYCNFKTQSQTATEQVDNIVVTTNPADTGVTAMGLSINTPFINSIACTVLTDSNPTNLVIQFQSETTAIVTTHAGSYYTNAVN